MDKKEKIIAFAYDNLAHDRSGHGFDHAQRVAKLSENILQEEAADEDVVLAAAYLHDTIDDKVVTNQELAVRKVQNFLMEIGFSEEQTANVLDSIQHLSFSKELEDGKQELSPEGQIVQDADRLEALGAVGIMRTAYFGGSHGHPLYDPAIKPRDYTQKAEYRKGSTVINHFYEKLFLLADSMNTEYGKKEGQRRKAFMVNFLEEFYSEWDV